LLENEVNPIYTNRMINHVSKGGSSLCIATYSCQIVPVVEKESSEGEELLEVFVLGSEGDWDTQQLNYH